MYKYGSNQLEHDRKNTTVVMLMRFFPGVPTSSITTAVTGGRPDRCFTHDHGSTVAAVARLHRRKDSKPAGTDRSRKVFTRWTDF